MTVRVAAWFGRSGLLLLLVLRSVLRGNKAIVDLAPDLGGHLVLVAVDVGVLVVDVVATGSIVSASLLPFGKQANGKRRVALAILGLELLLDRILVAVERVVDVAPDISSALVIVGVLVRVLVVDGRTLDILATCFDTGNEGQSSNDGELKWKWSL